MLPLTNASIHLSGSVRQFYPRTRSYVTLMGGHGIGKTFLACALWDFVTGGVLLDECMIDLGPGIKAHAWNGEVLMIGKYGSTRKCGGMDTIRTDHDRLYTALELAWARPEPLVIGEGMTINSKKMVQWYADNAERFNRHVLILHLIGHADEQIARIKARSGRDPKPKYIHMKNNQFDRVAAWIGTDDCPFLDNSLCHYSSLHGPNTIEPIYFAMNGALELQFRRIITQHKEKAWEPESRSRSSTRKVRLRLKK